MTSDEFTALSERMDAQDRVIMHVINTIISCYGVALYVDAQVPPPLREVVTNNLKSLSDDLDALFKERANYNSRFQNG